MQGISPEDFKIREKIEKFVKFRNKFMPDKEIWLSEFGYNTSANTIYSAPQIGNFQEKKYKAFGLFDRF